MFDATTTFSYPQPPPTRRGRVSHGGNSRGNQISIKNTVPASQIKPAEVIDYKHLTGYYSSNSKVTNI